MKTLTAVVAGLALLLVAAAATPSTSSAAGIDLTPQDLSSTSLQSGIPEWCFEGEVQVVGMLSGPLGSSSILDASGANQGDGKQPIVDPCRPWDTPCEINPNFPICNEPLATPEPGLPPVIKDICFEGVFYPGADVAGADPSVYTEGECPVDEEPTAEPTDEPTEEPTEEAPPPAETGNAGLASAATPNAWAMAAMTLVLSSALGAGALAVRRR